MKETKDAMKFHGLRGNGGAIWRGGAALARVLVLLLGVGVQAAHAGDLATLLTELYGGDGIVLGSTGAPVNHAPHFSADSLENLNALSEDLTSALGTFASNSTVSSYTFDLERGVPVRTTDSLGPILSERATTLGARRLNVGFSYTRVDFKRFEGTDLDDTTLFFTHEDINGDGILGPNDSPSCPPGTCPFLSDVETDRVQVDLDIKLAQDIYSLYGTFGVLRNLDIGVAIPILRVDLRANATARVDRHAVCINPPVCSIMSTDVHNFAVPPDLTADPPEDFMTSSVEDTATGIGDVLIRGKYNFYRGDGWAPNLAVLGQVKLPTGDEDNLLGTGDTRGMAMFIADTTYGFVSPHVNVGFEIVGESELNNLKYFVGFDARLHKRVTAVFDLLGRWEPAGDGIGDHLLDTAIGGKFSIFRSLVLVANFIIPVNGNDGLRTDFAYSFGIEYTFGGPR